MSSYPLLVLPVGPPGWHAVARVQDVGTAPVEVVAAGHRYVAFRPDPAASVAVVAARCPHRLVRLDHAEPVEQAVLAEDLELQAAMTVTGLPLRMADELHVRSDRGGVALRRIWRRLLGLDPAV